jgi:hypothetical protein
MGGICSFLLISVCSLRFSFSLLVVLQGMGGYHGKFSFECFSHRRTVMRRDDHMLLDVPVRYPPYNDTSLRIFRNAAKLPSLPIITQGMLWKVVCGSAVIVSVVIVAKWQGAF